MDLDDQMIAQGEAIALALLRDAAMAIAEVCCS